MGTLQNQPPRPDYITRAMVALVVEDLTKAPGVKISLVLELAEHFRKSHSADVLDEQLAGFGEILLEGLNRLVEIESQS